MADDIIALSFQGPEPTDADFEAIRDAFMETARGRWFLAEYARRNRHADTTVLLAALGRIESLLLARRDSATARTGVEANPGAIKPDGTVTGKGAPADVAAWAESDPAPAPEPRPAPAPGIQASFAVRDPILLGDDDPMPAILAAAEKMARARRGRESGSAPARPVTIELRPIRKEEQPDEPKSAESPVPAESEPAAPRSMPSARLRGIFNEVHRARWGSQADTVAAPSDADDVRAAIRQEQAGQEQKAEPSPAPGGAEPSPKPEPIAMLIAANDAPDKPAAPQTQSLPPRPAADDPLAAIVCLSDEEKIALFS